MTWRNLHADFEFFSPKRLWQFGSDTCTVPSTITARGIDWLRLRCRRLRSDAGTTMVEYALMVALVAVIVASAATILGGGIADTLNGAATTMSGSGGAHPAGGGGSDGQGGGWGGGVGGGKGHK